MEDGEEKEDATVNPAKNKDDNNSKLKEYFSKLSNTVRNQFKEVLTSGKDIKKSLFNLFKNNPTQKGNVFNNAEEIDINKVEKIVHDSGTDSTDPTDPVSATKESAAPPGPDEELKNNDKMMKLLTLREDYMIFNILNVLLDDKKNKENKDGINLNEIIKTLDFGKFVDEIGILKNDEEESTNNEEEEKEE